MTEQEIINALSTDLSEGTEQFRDALLAKCLATLASNAADRDVADDDLEMLAAAGLPLNQGPLA